MAVCIISQALHIGPSPVMQSLVISGPITARSRKAEAEVVEIEKIKDSS